MNAVYKYENLFPVFASRLPDRRRKDIKKILYKYGLLEYDSYELLRRSGAKLPTDHLQFRDLLQASPNSLGCKKNEYKW